MKRLPILQLILLWLLSCSQLALADRITYFHYDATGTAIMATDEQANVLWKRAPTAYGETPEFHPAMKKYNHRMTVAGHYDDWETGLIYMGKRYYSPKLGRFLTPDPVGVHPHLPQSFNRYGYANNNPYKFVDTDGRSSLNHLRKLLVNGGNLRETFQGQMEDISTLVNPQQSLAARGLALASLASEVLPVSGRDVKGLYRWLSPCSFTAGTQVGLADGLANIESIDIGARVWALEDTNSSPKLADVTGIYRRLVDSTYTLQVGDEQIEVTGEHPFWVYQRGWLTVEQLRIGDLLRSKDGVAIPIKAIQQKHQRVTVYNLEVDQLHNYFAGKSQVLVHNCVPKMPISVDDAFDEASKFLKNGVPVRSIDGKTGVQFIQEFTENGQQITKRVGFDLNPNSSHVKQLGPHLNLQTQIDGIIQKGTLADPHIPIDPKTIRPGDY